MNNLIEINTTIKGQALINDWLPQLSNPKTMIINQIIPH